MIPDLISLQVLVEPADGLAEGLFLGPFLLGVVKVSAHSKAVADTAEEVDLPRLSGLDEGILGLVAELGGEDGIDLCGGN